MTDVHVGCNALLGFRACRPRRKIKDIADLRIRRRPLKSLTEAVLKESLRMNSSERSAKSLCHGNVAAPLRAVCFMASWSLNMCAGVAPKTWERCMTIEATPNVKDEPRLQPARLLRKQET